MLAVLLVVASANIVAAYPLVAPNVATKVSGDRQDLFGFSGACSRLGTTLAWDDGNLLGFLQGSVAELGAFRSCVAPPTYGVYCTADLVFECVSPLLNHTYTVPRFSSCGASSDLIPELAFCVPEACGIDDLATQLRADSRRNATWWGALLQDTYGFSPPPKYTPGPCLLGGSGAIDFVCDPARSYAYLQAKECTRNGNPLREDDAWKRHPGRRNMVIVMLVITAVCALATSVTVCRLLYGFLRRLVDEIVAAPEPDAADSGDDGGNKKKKKGLSADDVSLASQGGHRRGGEEPLLTNDKRREVNDGGASVQVPPSAKAKAGDAKPKPSGPARVLAGFLEVLGYFDVIANVQNLTSVTKRHTAAVDTRWMEGVRVLSMSFVVFGHTVFFPQNSIGYRNVLDGYLFTTTYAAIGIFPAELAVDAFFFMSGYLVYYLYFNAVDKQHVKDIATWKKQQGGAAGGASAASAGSAAAGSLYVALLDDEGNAVPPPKRPMGIVATLLMYVHRWLRIAPVMGLVIFFLVYVGPLIPSGPLYKTASTLSPESCITSGAWWRYLLFASDVDNPRYQICAPWFWYLTCDFQMFLVAPLVCALRFIHLPTIVPVAAWRAFCEARLPRSVIDHFGCVAFYTTVLAFVASGVGLATHYMPFGSIWYFSATSRWSPYAYGVLFSGLIREPWIRAKLDKFLVRFALLSAGTILAVGCINGMWKMNAWEQSAALSKYVREDIGPKSMPSKGYIRWINFVAEGLWGPALGCFSLAWGAGHGGWLVSILGHPVLVVLSKLTFCNYMIHPVLIIVFYASQDDLPVFSQLNLYGYYFMFLPMTFVISALMHVTLELPVAKLNTLLARLYK